MRGLTLIRYAAFAFEKSLHVVVDEAHKYVTSTAAMECGIALRDELDYSVLIAVSLLETPSPYKNTDFEELEDPTIMDNSMFYKNLGRVVRGELWFYTQMLTMEFIRRHTSPVLYVYNMHGKCVMTVLGFLPFQNRSTRNMLE